MSNTKIEKLHVFPDCRCQFVQPFLCTTCGAQRLYDHTVKSQAATIEHMQREREAIRKIVFRDGDVPSRICELKDLLCT